MAVEAVGNELYDRRPNKFRYISPKIDFGMAKLEELGASIAALDGLCRKALKTQGFRVNTSRCQTVTALGAGVPFASGRSSCASSRPRLSQLQRSYL